MPAYPSDPDPAPEPVIEDRIRKIIDENHEKLLEIGIPPEDAYRLALSDLIHGHMPEITEKDRILKSIQAEQTKILTARISIKTLAKKLEDLQDRDAARMSQGARRF